MIGVVAAALQRLSQVLLGQAVRTVDVCRVEEVDPELERSLDDGRRLPRIATMPEVVAAEPHDGHHQARSARDICNPRAASSRVLLVPCADDGVRELLEEGAVARHLEPAARPGVEGVRSRRARIAAQSSAPTPDRRVGIVPAPGARRETAPPADTTVQSPPPGPARRSLDRARDRPRRQRTLRLPAAPGAGRSSSSAMQLGCTCCRESGPRRAARRPCAGGSSAPAGSRPPPCKAEKTWL